MDYLQKFQEQNGLSPDGKIGPNTFKKMRQVFGLSATELVMFLGQVIHETAGFKYAYENLNYSASALARTWPSRYAVNSKSKIKEPNATALRIQRNPVAIGNNVYANRMGNGNEASGDGFKHRGIGALQLTGKRNQERFADKVKDPRIKDDPTLIAEKYYFESALYYFEENSLWKYCKEVTQDNIIKLSKAINLGSANSRATPNGLSDRLYQTNKLKRLI